jgi:hypothetical protein
MATIEIKMALSLLLRQFSFEAMCQDPPKPAVLLTIIPNEIRLRLTPRTRSNSKWHGQVA